MKFVFILLSMGLFNFAQANIADTQPTVDTVTTQAELMEEFDTVSEDVEFDSEDEIFLSSDETLIVDPEIEKVSAKKAPAGKLEAKATTQTKTTEQK